MVLIYGEHFNDEGVVDITNQIKNQINYDRRVDEVFDTGSFTFESKEINYNIAPLTLCKIDDEYWLCSSECNAIIPTEYYNHNVQLLELTYLLHTIILGSKAFSNSGQYKTHNDKLSIIQELIYEKLGVSFEDVDNHFEIEHFIDSKNIEREFAFGAGTSAFQMLLEIGNTVDAIPRLKLIDGTQTIVWDYLDNNSIFNLEENRILATKYFQDVENYTSMLETEITNVVDRDSIQVVNNLSVSSEEAIVNEDNQVLILPSRVEEVTTIEINLPFFIGISMSEIDSSYFATLTPDDTDGADELYYFSTLENDSTFAPVAAAFKKFIYSRSGVYITDDMVFRRYYGGMYEVLSYNGPKGYVEPINLHNYILEEKQWDLLDLDDKPNYMYYTSGSNIIQNIYKKYKGDFWSEILNQSSGPVLKKMLSDLNFTETFSYGKIQMNNTLSSDYENPMNATFNVSYIPIVDTYIRSDNVKTPFNESNVKPSSRSFEANASISDYNLLVDSINRTNDMLGMPEVTINYVGKTYPKPTDLIVIKEQNYYVSSVQTSIISDRYVSYINLVSNYSKVAEVFGVATQYESTKLPLTGIIDRFVYCGEFSGIDEATGIRIRPTTSSTYYYKRGVKLAHKNSKYLIVAADDNYTFTKGLIANSLLIKSGYENYQYSYGNLYNEMESYNILIVKEADKLTLAESRALPLLTNYTELKNTWMTTYKDARERLIFVFKMI